MPGFVHHDIVADQLAIVFIGSEHESLHSRLSGFCSEGTDDVVGLKAVGLVDRYAKRLENVLDPGHALFDILRSLVALRLVGGESLVAEGLAMVEGHA